jgi:transposase
MIEPDKRKAIYLLHQEGMEIAEIARRLGVSPSTVAVIIQQKGVMPHIIRSDKQQIDPELLRRLYQQCEGRIQRVYEKLVEEENIQVKYSTLTRMLRELGISGPQKVRCERVPDQPGAEMQHDTTVYRIKLGDHVVKVIASLLYLRYSKRRYLKFYRVFNRFKMKVFLHEGLMLWGYAALQCIIDNTNLARLRGTGHRAVIHPEMEGFGKQHGFEFICHEVNHPNRKAGEERAFWTVETNFLPGRNFQSLEDLNQQAFEWSTVRMDNKPQGNTSLIPAKAFEHERGYLTPLPAHLPAPYEIHDRGTDQYGYTPFDSNYYWVPGTKCEDVMILEYGNVLKIYQAREFLIEYPLPADGVRNKLISPEGSPPPYKPKNRKKPAQEEEKRLRAMAQSVNAYLDWALATKGLQRHEFLRKLMALSRQMTPELFIKTIERASKFRIISIETIARIAVLYLGEGSAELPVVEVDESFRERPAYQEGALTEPPDLSIYKNMLEEDHEDHEDHE